MEVVYKINGNEVFIVLENDDISPIVLAFKKEIVRLLVHSGNDEIGNVKFKKTIAGIVVDWIWNKHMRRTLGTIRPALKEGYGVNEQNVKKIHELFNFLIF